MTQTALYRHCQFPASWYAVMLELCAERGLLCPFELFAWEKSQDKKAAAA